MAGKAIKRVVAAVFLAAACVLASPLVAWAAPSTDSNRAIKVEYEGETPTLYADRLNEFVSEGTNIIGNDTLGARTITLQKDISISDGIKFYGDVTLDLNGHNITAQISSSPSQRQLFVAASSSDPCNLIVTDSVGGGKIVATGFESILKTADASAKLSVKGGTFVLTDHAAARFVVESEKGEVAISGGTYVNLALAERASLSDGPGCLLTSSSSKKVTVTGGSFMNAAAKSSTIVGTAGELVIEPATGSSVRVTGGACALYVEGGSIGATAGDPSPNLALTINGGTFESGQTVASTSSGYEPLKATNISGDVALLVSTGKGNSINQGKSVDALVKDGTFVGTTSVQLGSTNSGASNENSTLTLEQGTFAGRVVMGNNFASNTTGGLTIKANPEVTYTKNSNISSAYSSGFVLAADGSTKLPLLESSVTFGSEVSNLVYDGVEKKPKVIVTLGGHVCSEGTDYTATYENNVNAGENTAVVTVTAVEGGNYSGSVVKRFTIKPKEFVTSGTGRNTVVTLAQSTVPYCELSDASGVYYYFTPSVSVAVDASVIDPSNYDLTTMADPTNYVGTITITGKGNYSGTAVVQCTIVKGVAVTFIDGREPSESDKRIIEVKAVFPYSASASTSTGSVTPPTPPEHEGWAFAGWVGNYSHVTEDSTVIARYVEDTYGTGIVVSFVDPRNNNEVIKAEAVALGGTATPPTDAEIPHYDGYSFVGWSGSYSNVTESTTVTARYMAEGGHHVSFIDPLNNNEVIKREVVPDGGAATAPLESEMPSHVGYRHVGWDKAFDKVESDLQVGATYEPCETFTVTFVDTMQNDKVIKEVQANKDGAAEPPTEAEMPVHEGYDFAGWEGNYTKVTEDTTVKTKWEKQPEPPKPAAGDMAVITHVTLEDGTSAIKLLDENGKPASGWLLVGGNWYIGDENGIARTGVYNVGSTTYVLSKEGVLQTGWIFLFDMNAWVYANPGTTGNYAAIIKGEWFWDGDGWYLASATGPIRVGWVEDDNGYRYHLNDGSNGTFGKMDANRWVLDGDSWYLVGANGAVTGGWQWIDGDWYYLNPEEGGDFGKLQTGWFWDGYHWYWTNYSGRMLRNQWVLSNGAWYYMGIDGAMRTGWQWIDGAWYYFDWNGVLFVNRMTPDGCLTGPDGRWI